MGLRRLLGPVCASLIMLASTPAWAVYNLLSPTDTGINGAKLTASPTFTARISDYSVASVYVQVTRAAATSIRMDCSSGPTPTVQGPISIAQVNSGTGAISMVPASWSYPITKSGMVRMQVAPLNDTYLVCKFSSPDATTDTVAVYAQLGG